MKLSELLETQHQFDESHGWSVDRTDARAVVQAVSDDIVGLVGELGEFANHIKKVNLATKSEGAEPHQELDLRRADLAEELVDTFIYLVRIATHLNVDLEAEYLAKLEFNRKRYAGHGGR
jgi:NTP pyrophosphatase (non-canonical NTP hydrolase)